ncbi:MAG: glycoside hydrolase family 3 N-terminal domain-containing protein [Acetobacteraceae bacterium]|nr:glycoside hydrolase family 3 N-terminal domain-containing protein [Acetobacteraceae bacterium]
MATEVDRLDGRLQGPVWREREGRGRRGVGLLSAGLLVLLVAGGAAAWFAWRAGGEGEVPMILADDSPLRVRPAEPGGYRVPNQDIEAYPGARQRQGERRIEVLLPPPEEPKPIPRPAPAAPQQAAAPPSPSPPRARAEQPDRSPDRILARAECRPPGRRPSVASRCRRARPPWRAAAPGAGVAPVWPRLGSARRRHRRIPGPAGDRAAARPPRAGTWRAPTDGEPDRPRRPAAVAHPRRRLSRTRPRRAPSARRCGRRAWAASSCPAPEPLPEATPRAAIVGLAGPELTADEARLFRRLPPFGAILFARNLVAPAQVAALVAAFRAAVGRADAPVLIDQEGGRVARLRPPHWRHPPPAARFGALYARDARAARRAAYLNARLIAEDLRSLGLTVCCAPVLDLPAEGADPVIGDRAFASDPRIVASLGRAVIRGLQAGGVIPVMKHIPGHGRARVDSHLALPVVETSAEELLAHDAETLRRLGRRVGLGDDRPYPLHGVG